MRGGFILSIVVCSAFLFIKITLAGGMPGEVIDYTLLEKLQEEYATSSKEYIHQPRISATTTRNDFIEEPISVGARADVEQDDKKAPFLGWLAGIIKKLFPRFE